MASVTAPNPGEVEVAFVLGKKPWVDSKGQGDLSGDVHLGLLLLLLVILLDQGC